MSGARRAQGDDGVAIVEMALVLPILVVLMLGMFTGALAWNQSQALGQGARVAARYASTIPLPVAGTDESQEQLNEAWLEDLALRAVAASEGQLGPGVAGRKVCVAYVNPDGVAPRTTMSLTLIGEASDGEVSDAPCFNDGQAAAQRRVQVELERSGHIDTGLYRFPLTIRRSAVYRYEADGGL